MYVFFSWEYVAVPGTRVGQSQAIQAEAHRALRRGTAGPRAALSHAKHVARIWLRSGPSRAWKAIVTRLVKGN